MRKKLSIISIIVTIIFMFASFTSPIISLQSETVETKSCISTYTIWTVYFESNYSEYG